MTTEAKERALWVKFRESPYYAAITAWGFGVITVIFLSLLGGAVSSSTNLVNISGKLVTSVRLASIGLGTGFYLGSSLKYREAGKSWFLFGVFSTLSALSYSTVDIIIFGQYPAYLLLVTGGILSISAHATPLVAENQGFLQVLKYTAGYLSTAFVVILATSEYILSAILFFWRWFQNLPIAEQAFLIALVLLASMLIYAAGEGKLNEQA